MQVGGGGLMMEESEAHIFGYAGSGYREVDHKVRKTSTLYTGRLGKRTEESIEDGRHDMEPAKDHCS